MAALCFALPGEVIGGPSGETVILKDAPSGIYDGSGGSWKTGGMARFAGLGPSRAVLAVSAAVAGPLLDLLNMRGRRRPPRRTKQHRQDDPSWCRGLGVGPRGSDPGYIRSWRATANAQEGAAALNTDTLLALDEIGVAEAKDAAAAIYQLSAGVGKGA